MDAYIAEIVRLSIRHARRLLREDAYSWPTAREALLRIHSDLEARSPNDPNLARLRAFIAATDRSWPRKNR